MNVRQLGAALHKRHSTIGAWLAAGMPRDEAGARAWLAKRGTSAPTVEGTAAGAPKRAGRSLADFRAQYDKSHIVPARVRDALHALGGGWEYEVQFAKMAGVSLQDLGRFRDQFASHVVQIGRDARRAWAGTVSTATAMKEMLS